MNIERKELAVIILKVIIYACTLLLAALGAVAVTSCTITRQSDVVGRAIIVTSDTTIINHSGTIKFPRNK